MTPHSVTMETSIQLHNLPTSLGGPRPPYKEEEKPLSHTRLGSSEVSPRTSDERVVGSNPREGICFQICNGHISVTTNRINKPDSLIERAREAL